MPLAVKCPSCGGTNIQVIRFQGADYYQCVTLKPRKDNDSIKAPCKYWSTKWRV